MKITATIGKVLADVVESARNDATLRASLALTRGIIVLEAHPHTQRIVRQSLIDGRWETTGTYDVVK